MNESIKKDIQSILEKLHEELQARPHQFVVAYYRVSDNSLIGYHASSFCQVTDDILRAKRYANENPYPQLQIISDNVKQTLSETHEGMFGEIMNSIKDNDFEGLKPEEVYMDAIYLAEGTPAQNFRYQIVSPDELNTD
jgi:hypothetical protein